MEERKGEILLYQTEDKKTQVQVRLEGETVWLTQRQLAELFQKDVRTVNEHIGNIFNEGELSPEATIRKFRIVQTEGNREVAREVEFYNLDVIISVGYRVKSVRGTQFRIWATQRLREYIVKGFVMDDECATGSLAVGCQCGLNSVRVNCLMWETVNFRQSVVVMPRLMIEFPTGPAPKLWR
jgi:hypothetical protein